MTDYLSTNVCLGVYGLLAKIPRQPIMGIIRLKKGKKETKTVEIIHEVPGTQVV